MKAFTNPQLLLINEHRDGEWWQEAKPIPPARYKMLQTLIDKDAAERKMFKRAPIRAGQTVEETATPTEMWRVTKWVVQLASLAPNAGPPAGVAEAFAEVEANEAAGMAQDPPAVGETVCPECWGKKTLPPDRPAPFAGAREASKEPDEP